MQLLQQTKATFDATKKANQKNITGVSEEPLFDVEPSNYIIPILHVQMGIVNKMFETMIAWSERNVELMSENDTLVRTKMISCTNDFTNDEEEWSLFVQINKPKIIQMKQQIKAATGPKRVKMIKTNTQTMEER